MLADIAAEHSSVQERYAEASDALSVPLWEIVSSGPEDRLGQTEITQPAILTASVALWDVWQAAGGQRPAAMAGHSLGEYSALVCAGAISFGDAVRLVHQRGRLMQSAVPEGQGLMAAIIGLDDDAVAAACAGVDGVVSAANINAPGQVVIAGETAAVEAAIDQLKEAGAKRALPLEVSVPSHCALMQPAAEQLGALLADIDLSQPQIPVHHNVDAEVSSSVDDIRARLVRQLSEPVQWTACVRSLAGLGIDRLVECGPGKVLSGLTRRIDKSVSMSAIGTADGLTSALEQN